MFKNARSECLWPSVMAKNGQRSGHSREGAKHCSPASKACQQPIRTAQPDTSQTGVIQERRLEQVHERSKKQFPTLQHPLHTQPCKQP